MRERIDGEKQTVETDIGRLSGELETAEQELPMDFKKEYKRVINARGEDALTSVNGGCCGGCFQTITPQMHNELQLARPVFCKTCGRLLYLPEEE